MNEGGRVVDAMNENAGAANVINENENVAGAGVNVEWHLLYLCTRKF